MKTRDIIIEANPNQWLHLRIFEDGRISYAVVREDDKFGEKLRPLPLD